jgi:hypothetical protein
LLVVVPLVQFLLNISLSLAVVVAVILAQVAVLAVIAQAQILK